MPTQNELFKHIKKHLGLRLQEDPRWSSIAQQVDWGASDLDMFATSLSYVYIKLVKEDPELAILTNNLFKELVIHYITKTDIQTSGTTKVLKLFRAWTQHGTHDISDQDAADLKDHIHVLLNDSYYEEDILRSINYSKKLWVMFEPLLLGLAAENRRCNVRIDAQGFLPHIIHRHAPHLTDFYNPEKREYLYYSMCGGEFNDTAPLTKMDAVLTGQHHNAYAWNIAIKVCSRTDCMNTKWMQMLPAFASLPLDPSDQESWKFWNSIRERSFNDTSARHLVNNLSEVHEKMHQAFIDIWNIVDTLEEGDTRYEQATKLYAAKKITLQSPIALPQMDYAQL